MALTAIVCPHCTHSGYVPVGALGRILRCHGCGHAHMVRKGEQVIRSRYIDDGSDDDAPTNGIDDDVRWATYEGCPAAPLPKASPAQRPRRPRKRRLTPRVPETEGV
jgi:hypothetical protein